MARIRQIKPEFFLDEDLSPACSRDTRIFFIGLWTLADREGRLEDRPARFKAQIFPYDDDIQIINIIAFIDQLQEKMFVLRYEIDGKRYLWIRTFKKHQHFHRDEQGSKLPEPPKDIELHRASTMQAPDNNHAGPVLLHEIGVQHEVNLKENKEDIKLHPTCTPTSTSTSTSTSTYGLRLTASGEIASQSKPVAKRRRQTQQTGCPEIFEPSDSMKEWASNADSSLNLKVETEKFLDYHKAKGSSFADWDAAWRTWIRNAVKFNSNGGFNGNKPAAAREITGDPGGTSTQRNSRGERLYIPKQ